MSPEPRHSLACPPNPEPSRGTQTAPRFPARSRDAPICHPSVNVSRSMATRGDRHCAASPCSPYVEAHQSAASILPRMSRSRQSSSISGTCAGAGGCIFGITHHSMPHRRASQGLSEPRPIQPLSAGTVVAFHRYGAVCSLATNVARLTLVRRRNGSRFRRPKLVAGPSRPPLDCVAPAEARPQCLGAVEPEVSLSELVNNRAATRHAADVPAGRANIFLSKDPGNGARPSIQSRLLQSNGPA